MEETSRIMERGAAMTREEQLQRWVNGESVHRGGEEEGGCCPDFSCCIPELQASAEVRQKFAEADYTGRLAFLGMFLAAAISNKLPTASVHLIGFGEGNA